MVEVDPHTDEIDGEPVSWRSGSADGTPTLYLHGVPNSSLMWLPFLERTGGVALDLPGFGDSVKPGTLAAAGERLGEIDSPALIVWGERDPYIPSRAAAQYAGALGGESELALLADAGHWPWLDPPDVVDTVARFLARN